VLTLLLKTLLFSELLKTDRTAMILAAMVVSRTAQVFLCATQPYARPTGTAAATVQNAGARHLCVALLLCVLLLSIAIGPRGPLLLAVGLAAAFLWGLYCKRRVGGITGDLLGASSEIVEISVMTTSLLLTTNTPAL
jgi:adenosylcobinamide-GDP ribazoletransferase